MISPPDGTVLYVLQGMRREPGPITRRVLRRVAVPSRLYSFGRRLLLMPGIALWLPSDVR